MQSTRLTDFYRAWMIEVTETEAGFQNECRASNGSRMVDGQIYTHEQAAWKAAVDLIDRYHSSCEIQQALRNSYESGSLEFAEWQMLSHCLNSEFPWKSHRVR